MYTLHHARVLIMSLFYYYLKLQLSPFQYYTWNPALLLPLTNNNNNKTKIKYQIPCVVPWSGPPRSFPAPPDRWPCAMGCVLPLQLRPKPLGGSPLPPHSLPERTVRSSVRLPSREVLRSVQRWGQEPALNSEQLSLCFQKHHSLN